MAVVAGPASCVSERVVEAAVTIVTGGEQLDDHTDQQQHHEQRDAQRDPAKELAALLGVDVPDQITGRAVARVDHRQGFAS